ncbi:MAG: phosphoribosylformylglycinamidine synthase subunit PurL [Ktedonobacteraceae bacterium]
MTVHYIEVRAVLEQHDVQAHRLARQIIQLSPHRLPSLASLSTTPLSIRTAFLYRLSGTLDASQLDQLISQLLVDPVIQEALVVDNLYPDVAQHIVDVFFHPGVTDTLAESVHVGAHMLNISTLQQVQTGKRYFLDNRLSPNDARTIAVSLLYNSVIQHYEFRPASQPLYRSDVSHPTPHQSLYGSDVSHLTSPHPSESFLTMNDEQLLSFSKAGLLSLNLDEMCAIQQHYREQAREPTAVELETLAQTWSEHCSHKTFKATIEYREFDTHDTLVVQETIPGLLKRYIMRATEHIRPNWLVSAFRDNAGIVRFTDTHDIAFKVETHNHPSAIEPFGGANTGVGGVIRDVLGVSAQPIACTDILCFGPPNTPTESLPAGILAPQRIATGVVDGVRDYGNKMGIPTVNGAILYHRGYIYNPLVFCGCLGILPHGSHPSNVEAGDNVVVLGGRTGRDGVHGATFSSGEMSVEINAQAGTAVQIGAPITEKKVADVILQARDRKLYHAITDCGAGGFSSAIGEMGADTGVRVELAHAPLKYQGLAPWEIWLSEAQERMVLAVPSAHLDALLELCAIEEVEASILGTFTDDHRLTVTYHEQTVASIDMAFLHDGRPNRTLEAEWKPASEIPYRIDGRGRYHIPPTPTSLLLSLLQHPSISSKEAVVRRYDHEVQGATVLKPLVGKTGQGPGDAAVLQPLLADGTQTRAGIVLSNGVNPLLGTIDPYSMAVNAVDEALRNLTAVGGDITRVSLLDNFCWGNPTDSAQLGMLVRAVKGCHDAAVGFKTPFISGKDSLNNEYRADGKRLPVLPTLVISAVGVIDDAAQTIDMSLKTPGNLLYLIGTTRDEMAGSHYTELMQSVPDATKLPQVNIEHAYTTMKALGEAIRKGMVRACHDLSEGGLAVAAAEMAIASQLGMTLDLAYIPVIDMPERAVFATKNIVRLFSESVSRFIVEIAPEQWGTFEKHMRFSGVTDVTYIGTVTNTDTFIVREGSDTVIDVSIADLQQAFEEKL